MVKIKFFFCFRVCVFYLLKLSTAEIGFDSLEPFNILLTTRLADVLVEPAWFDALHMYAPESFGRACFSLSTWIPFSFFSILIYNTFSFFFKHNNNNKRHHQKQDNTQTTRKNLLSLTWILFWPFLIGIPLWDHSTFVWLASLLCTCTANSAGWFSSTSMLFNVFTNDGDCVFSFFFY